MWPFRKKRTPDPEGPTIVIDPFQRDPIARQVHDAMAARDWDTVRRVFDGPLTEHQRSRYLDAATHAPGVPEWIETVCRDHPAATLPLLVRGINAIFWAWELRGSGYAHTVAQDKWATIGQRLKLAENCLDEVVERDPACAEAREYLISLAMARSLGMEEKWKRFEALVAVAPTHDGGHRAMLQALAAKWGGSTEEMFRFARERAAFAPGTALPGLIAQAHLEEWLRRDDGDAYMEQAEVGEELVHAAEQSIWHPAFEPAGGTVALLNTFAYALSLADRFTEAERCYARIGDDLVTAHPWDYYGHPVRKFIAMRDYVRSRLDG